MQYLESQINNNVIDRYLYSLQNEVMSNISICILFVFKLFPISELKGFKVIIGKQVLFIQILQEYITQSHLYFVCPLNQSPDLNETYNTSANDSCYLINCCFMKYFKNIYTRLFS